MFKRVSIAHGSGLYRSVGIFSEFVTLGTPYENASFPLLSSSESVTGIANRWVTLELDQARAPAHQHNFHNLVFGPRHSQTDSCDISVPTSRFPSAIGDHCVAAGDERGIPELASSKSVLEVLPTGADICQPGLDDWNGRLGGRKSTENACCGA
jgi:hypothetical protein